MNGRIRSAPRAQTSPVSSATSRRTASSSGSPKCSCSSRTFDVSPASETRSNQMLAAPSWNWTRPEMSGN